MNREYCPLIGIKAIRPKTGDQLSVVEVNAKGRKPRLSGVPIEISPDGQGIDITLSRGSLRVIEDTTDQGAFRSPGIITFQLKPGQMVVFSRPRGKNQYRITALPNNPHAALASLA